VVQALCTLTDRCGTQEIPTISLYGVLQIHMYQRRQADPISHAESHRTRRFACGSLQHIKEATAAIGKLVENVKTDANFVALKRIALANRSLLWESQPRPDD
jgi:hypothetical protein